jgi:hypothetical protein
MRPLFVVLVAAGVVTAGPGSLGVPPAAGPGQSPRLNREDADYLDGLLRDFLFDPRGATRVRITVRMPGPPPPDGVYMTHDVNGWLIRGDPARVYFADGGWVPAPPPGQIRLVPFVGDCRERYHAIGRPPPAPRGPESGELEDWDLVTAAWLHRLGHDWLAARALAAARGRDTNCEPREELRRALAGRAADQVLDAFCRRADAEARAHGERLFCLYPDLAEDFPYAETILADLNRRQRAGTFDRTPPAGFPPWFALWDPRQKLKCLTAVLDQIDTEPRWRSSYLGPDDPRYEALVGLGELAVPALLDVMEADTRLTRLPERHRGDVTGRVITVREMAEAAVGDILGVREFDPTGGPPDQDPVARLAQMRRWWAAYGKLAPDERMMKILTDPRATRAARVEAAWNLARRCAAHPERWDRSADREARWPNPVVAKFHRPTGAEAILAALDRDRPAPADPDRESWEAVESNFLSALVELGDGRVAAELSRRAARITESDRRRMYAVAAHRLGAPGALVALARDFERGALALGRGPDGERTPHQARAELAWYLDEFDRPLPDADRALYALADPDHPWHRLYIQAMLDNGPDSHYYPSWHQHPVCLAALRRVLNDAERTGRHFYLRGDEIEEAGGRRSQWSALPADRRDPAAWAEHAEERTCDAAAVRVTELVVGVPAYHPLHRDADKSLAALKVFLDRHGRRFRRLTEAEARRFDFRARDPAYVPDIRPLGRPATAADVAAGRAVFHLNGKGKPAANPPAWVALTGNLDAHWAAEAEIAKVAAGAGPASDVDPPAVGLVVQAEAGPGGRVYYGVVFRHAIRVVRAGEVEAAPRR